MLMWSYFAAVLTDPGRVPPGWTPFGSDEVISHNIFRAGHRSLLSKASGTYPSAPSIPNNSSTKVYRAITSMARFVVSRKQHWRRRGWRLGWEGRTKVLQAAGGRATAASAM